jgi:hypothetical protein
MGEALGVEAASHNRLPDFLPILAHGSGVFFR